MNPMNILCLVFLWASLEVKERARERESLAAVTVNFSPDPPGCSGTLFSRDGPQGSGA